MKISEISIKRPSIIIVLFIILILGGLFSYKNLKYELIPKFELNIITIATVYPGASPSVVENTVSTKIENVISSMENIKKISTKSYENLSITIITLNSEAEINNSLNDAQRKVNGILKDLPKDIYTPSVNKFSLGDIPIMTLAVTSDLEEKELFDLLDKKIQPLLSRINGVATVKLIGGEEREIKVSLDPKKIEAYGLNLFNIQQIIIASNLDFPTGNLKSRDNLTTIRLSGKYKNIEELRNLIIYSKDDITVRLADVADVQDSQKEVEKIAHLDQKSAILLQITKQTDANAVSVSELTKETITKIEKEYKDLNIKIEIANDSSEFTLEAANSVMTDLLFAIILVSVVMLFFLHSLRNSIIVMIAIPLSLISTFIGIYIMGYTLNLMSLLGLSLVVGVLVDDAIVVIENIHRHMEMGKNRVRAAYDGTSEIGFTVTSITLVIVVVFLPISFSTGLVSNIISQFCVVVVIATLLSLLVSFTVVPWLFSRYGKIEVISKNSIAGRILNAFERGLGRFTYMISNLLIWSLKSVKNKIITLTIVTLILISSISLIPLGYIGGQFFPDMDRGQFLVQLEMEKDASIESTNFMTQKAEKYLSSKKDVKKLITTVGMANSGDGATQNAKNKSEITVILTDKSLRDDSSDIYAAKIKKELEKELVGAKIKTAPYALIGVKFAPIALTVSAPNLDDALEFVLQAESQLKKIDGATDVSLTSEKGSPEISVQIDRDKMANLGLNMQIVGSTMMTAFSGNTDGKFRSGEYEYDINIQYQEFSRENIEDVRNISFTNTSGKDIKLQQFADIINSSGPTLLERRDKSPSITIQAQTVGKTAGIIAREWEEKFSKIEKKQGVNYVWDGDMENQNEGFGSLGIALLAAIILVYLVMVALYDSFVTPFIVMFSVPLSFIGALLALALTNEFLNVYTILGIIMLIGLVCKNAILLVDFANHRKEAGDSTTDALIAANHTRLRPILMTTTAMVIGVLPIAIAKGAAAEINNGLAIVIIGGLLSSLFLTLVIVPIIYSIFDSIGNKYGKTKKVDYNALIKEDYLDNN